MFIPPNDKPYRRFIKRLHKNLAFEWYLEIGCRGGRIFEAAQGKTIAVDPFFRIERNVVKTKPELHIMQQTSDAFFDGGFLRAIRAQLSFSFLDGMHLIEYLLRDFINTERHSNPDGVIAIHDCCPYNHDMTTRDLDNAPAEAWTGDVWKIIPILQAYRPDLKLTVLGCEPTGLLLVSNLNPRSRKLSSNYDKIIQDWASVTLLDYGTERFFAAFDYTRAHQIEKDGYTLFDRVRLDDGAVRDPHYVSP